MQFSRALIALVAVGLASAQLPNVPACSLNCFVTALTTDGCSDLTDFACHCQKTQLVGSITPCVKKACDEADQSSVSSAVESQCSAAGHPISVPPVGGETTTAAGTTTGAGATTTATGGQTTATGTQTSGGATGSSSATSSSAASSSGAAGSGSASGSASASKPAFTGAASNTKSNMAGVAAIAAAAAYVL